MKILIEESVLRQWKEALESNIGAMRGLYGGWRCTKPLKASDEAIASMQSHLDAAEKVEPVGHVVEWLDGSLVHGWLDEAPPVGTPLYTTPPTNTDSELREAARAVVEHYKESHGEEWYGIDRLRKALK